MYRRWRSFWSGLFGGPSRWSGKEKALGYIVHRLEAGARLQEVVQEGYVRRMTTPGELEQILADPRVIESSRRRLVRDLASREASPRTTSPADGQGPTPKVGVWFHGRRDR